MVTDAIDALCHSCDDDPWLAARLIADLDAARAGIARLQTTYASDSLIVAQLQVLVERIEQATRPVQKNNAML